MPEKKLGKMPGTGELVWNNRLDAAQRAALGWMRGGPLTKEGRETLKEAEAHWNQANVYAKNSKDRKKGGR